MNRAAMKALTADTVLSVMADIIDGLDDLQDTAERVLTCGAYDDPLPEQVRRRTARNQARSRANVLGAGMFADIVKQRQFNRLKHVAKRIVAVL